ncbi:MULTISPECIES: RusA family crossover junction endodeoxyribonuclease [unclassified Cryobacterium]|uniref:RusA family crossover junction endodeoxyribonuclease n=1 Tax=unclassified Cryobacterium TaxID=2649013 RepID=UPI001069FACA|nr:MULTISPECIES: RusA family crossover junction endodeoxyribonuclease [unclassified Cryobacterium]TFC59453.1 RusA family crossover junction endodeoxyribonuclease [Cryobacterium sp. TMB3-1-2]TFC67249.1 RusA family crossover junction endodeoxyribonuclease [Cryobacterium sp. TMB3-15]TFC73238.1 RusA family crossover junction endodeoxyribonuclease [Cryobacterium sp. TMB3-10]TFD46126.1 RusA family crossover junction endodeoxyribonuclease [Cryobacterium sp. TMB3-12]
MTDYRTLPARVIETPPALPLVEFFIPGVPVQQGSKSGFSPKGSNRVQMTDQNKVKLKPWRATVTTHTPVPVVFDCPVYVELTFVMPRPKKPRFKTPAVMPDIDKLTRAVFDGITDAGLWKDDARVVRMLVAEEYAGEGNPVGVHVAVSEA